MWVLIAAARAACPDRYELVDDAQEALVLADFEAVDAALSELWSAMGCGPIADPSLLGEAWLIEGASHSLQGDDQAASDAWLAAGRVSPGRWIEDFGPKLRAKYETAVAVTLPATRIDMDPPLQTMLVAIDGVVVEHLPATVDGGLHVVQIGPTPDAMQFGRVTYVEPGGDVKIGHDVKEVLPVAPPPTPIRTARPQRPPLLYGHAATGIAASIGTPVQGADTTEPGAKVVVPVEAGVRYGPRALWLRAAVAAGYLVNGQFQYEDEFGPTQSPTTLGANVGGGYATEGGDFGAVAVIQWPERFGLHLVLAGNIPSAPVKVEARIGLNLPEGRAPEPLVGVLLDFAPVLLRI